MARTALAGLLLLITAAPVHADLDEIKKTGVLRVLAVAANTPVPGKSTFLAVEKGVATGFDAELLSGFARAQGLKMTVSWVPAWDRLLVALAEGQGDVVAGNVTATEARRQLVDFTTETLPTRALLVSYPPGDPILSLDKLGDLKVGVVKGTAPREAALEAGVPRANLDDSLVSGTLFEALTSGKLRVAAMDLMAAVELQRRDPRVQLGVFVGRSESLGLAVRKDCPKLLKALNTHLGELKRSPNFYRILIANFGTNAPDVLSRLKAGKK